jgi:ABC-2 type transport system ATP-binding protein
VLAEHGVTALATSGQRVTGELPPDPPDLAEVNAALVAAGVRVRGFGMERASLEDTFVKLTGEGFDVAG